MLLSLSPNHLPHKLFPSDATLSYNFNFKSVQNLFVPFYESISITKPFCTSRVLLPVYIPLFRNSNHSPSCQKKKLCRGYDTEINTQQVPCYTFHQPNQQAHTVISVTLLPLGCQQGSLDVTLNQHPTYFFNSQATNYKIFWNLNSAD